MAEHKTSIRKAGGGYIVENYLGRETLCATFEKAVTVILRSVDPWEIKVGERCVVQILDKATDG